MDYKTVKIALIGAAAVGKTSLAKMLTSGIIDDIYTPTIGADIKYIYDLNNSLKISLWDLAGTTRFASLIQPFVKKVDLIFLCYNTHNILTLGQLRNIYRGYRAKNFLQGKKLIVIATKLDLCPDKEQKEGNAFAEEIGGCLFATSAKLGQGREEIMEYLRGKYNRTVKFTDDIDMSNNEPEIEDKTSSRWCGCLLS